MIDWDIWFRGMSIRASRECIVPEISRSFHMGESGVHIKGQVTYSTFVGHLATNQHNIDLHNIHRFIVFQSLNILRNLINFTYLFSWQF